MLLQMCKVSMLGFTDSVEFLKTDNFVVADPLGTDSGEEKQHVAVICLTIYIRNGCG